MSSIKEVLLIGNYQYDTTLKDFVYDMQREHKLQVRYAVTLCVSIIIHVCLHIRACVTRVCAYMCVCAHVCVVIVLIYIIARVNNLYIEESILHSITSVETHSVKL